MKTLFPITLLITFLGLTGCSPRNSGPEIEAQVIKATLLRVESWSDAVAAAKNPPSPFVAKLEFIVSPQYEGKSIDEIIALLPKDYPYTVVFLADERALEEKEFPFWCIDLLDEKKPRFRVEARQMASVANNLELANMDFIEFAEAAKKTGVFRGF
ncbi:MAG: hypothetical protein QM760_03635 [Nibricoccus sp.]